MNEGTTSLSLDDVVPYLLSRGWIDRKAVVDGDLSVVDVSRRNRNFKIIRRNGPSYLLKQAGEAAQSDRSLQREAEFYRRCASEPAAEALRPYLPRLVEHRPEDSLLLVELFRDAVPLWEHCGRFEPRDFPVALWTSLGRALGILHRTFRFRKPAASAPVFPWILGLHKPGPEVFQGMTPPALQVVKILQKEPGLSRRLDELRRDWSPSTLLHGDIKGDNLLVVPSSPDFPLRIVDWEICHPGDPAWDVGGALQDLLVLWILSMPLSSEKQARAMVSEARTPLGALHPAARAFLAEYRTTSGLTAADAPDFLRRAVNYAAARLLQSAYEHTYRAHHLPNPSVAMLQVSANMLSRPESASLHLLGIPPEWSSAPHALRHA